MKTQRNQTGRQIILPSRRPPGSTLLRLYILFSLLIPSSPACLITSCRNEPIDGPETDEEIYIPVDSTSYTVHFRNLGYAGSEDGRLDLFIYNADGVRDLLTRISCTGIPDSLRFTGPSRTYTAVAIANSPMDFNPAATERYDSMELLTYSFSDDSPGCPVMSGTCNIEPGSPCTIDLSPLMARVTLAEITNTMKGYVRLEDPRIRLENLNSGAEILRFAGFRPAETIETGEELRLPYDIGIFKQNPMSTLYCYPNDSPESTIGTPPTVFVLECEINGETCNFRVTLPAIERNGQVFVDLTVNGAENFESKAY